MHGIARSLDGRALRPRLAGAALKLGWRGCRVAVAVARRLRVTSSSTWEGDIWAQTVGRVAPDGTVLASAHDSAPMRVRVGQYVDLTALFGRREEQPVLDAVDALPSGAVFVDAGAHIGRYALRAAARVGPAGRVIAVEPDEGSRALLIENAVRQGVELRALGCALSRAAGTGALHRGRDAATNTLRAQWHGAMGTQTVATTEGVALRTLTEVLDTEGVRHVDLLKVDVEGAELDVLEGGRAALSAGRVSRVIVEVHGPLVTPEQCTALLEELGFSVRSLGEAGLEGTWVQR